MISRVNSLYYFVLFLDKNIRIKHRWMKNNKINIYENTRTHPLFKIIIFRKSNIAFFAQKKNVETI